MSEHRNWNGQSLDGDLLAVALSGSEATPTLNVATSLGGLAVIQPRQLGDFLKLHRSSLLACFDAARFHRTLQTWLDNSADSEGINILWGFSRDGRLHDVQIIDRLVRSAEQSARYPSRTLKELANAYCNPTSCPGAEDPDGVELILVVHRFLSEIAARTVSQLNIDHTLIEQFGLLGLRLEVQATIALDAVHAYGLRTEPEARQAAIQICESQRQDAINYLVRDREFRRCFSSHGGEVELNSQGYPRFDDEKLRTALSRITIALRTLHELRVPIPSNGNGDVSTDPSYWTKVAPLNSHLQAWADLISACELRKAIQRNEDGAFRPTYGVFPSLHSRPNLETARRFGLFPFLQPSPNHRLIVLELKDLELRALARILEQRHGPSRLAQDLRTSSDLHHHHACRLSGLTQDEFLCLLRDNQHDQFERWLKLACCALHAVPRAVDPDGLREIADHDFNIKLTSSDARSMHVQTLEAFPELSAYLRDDTVDRFSANLGCTAEVLLGSLDSFGEQGATARCVTEAFFATQPQSSHHILQALISVTGNQQMRVLLEDIGLNAETYELLIGQDLVTPTGQVFGRLGLWESLGAAHLHLADAARKASIYAITSHGHRLAAIAGDEFLVEVPIDNGTEVNDSAIERLAREAAEDVLGDIPVPVNLRRLTR